MTLPGLLQSLLAENLKSLGDNTAIKSTRSLGGGCINHAMRVETRKSSYFLKWNWETLPGTFRCEADGLRLLASTHTIRVPVVFAFGEAATDYPAFLLLEWLEGSGSLADQALLGEQLANLHKQSSILQQTPYYGLDHNNYLGSSRQQNSPEQDWLKFWIECRILPQVNTAQENGRLTPERRRRLERLIDKIPGYLDGVTRQPSLIHGDLWAGNMINSSSGLALIDPAVSFSDRETEIAYTELFGGFSTRFYSAYQHTWLLEPGYSERRDLYNLYHLLNHLNIFGESYGYQVDQVLIRYT
jgi:protein-ribulosamine 3-kinase